MRLKLVLACDPIDVMIATLQQRLDASRFALFQMLQKVCCAQQCEKLNKTLVTWRFSLNCWHDCDSRFSRRPPECAWRCANSADRGDAFQMHILLEPYMILCEKRSLCECMCVVARPNRELKFDTFLFCAVSASKVLHFSTRLFHSCFQFYCE